MPTACTRFYPRDHQRDTVAEGLVARLKQTNAGLTRFKCVGKVTLSGPGSPGQSFRAAMAGQLTDRLRIDMFAPFGGSTGSVASDGKNFFLVLHPSGEYHKRQFGSGSLQRLIRIDITVGDMLEMLVGRIPVEAEFSPRLSPDAHGINPQVDLVDRWGRLRQRITLDDSLWPVQSVWYDTRRNPVWTLTVIGRQMIDRFFLPRRLELSGAAGERASVALDRYEANARFDEALFRLPPPSS